MKLTELGEDGLLKLIRGMSGITDNDVSYIRLGESLLLLKIDGGAFSRTKMKFMTYYDVGWRTTVGALSDIYVKLGKPIALVSSITARRSLEVNDVMSVARGIMDAGNRYGAPLIGGDLNEGDDDVIDIAVLGIAEREIGRQPRPGDSLVTIPLFGFNGLGFKLWDTAHEDPTVRRGINMLKRPELPINVYGSVGRLGTCITASIDSSDGLGRALHIMGEKSRIIITQLPAPQEVIEAANRFGASIEELVFNAGEEYLPIFSVSHDCVDEFLRLGMIEFAKVEEGRGVQYNGGELMYKGWEYFVN